MGEVNHCSLDLFEHQSIDIAFVDAEEEIQVVVHFFGFLEAVVLQDCKEAVPLDDFNLLCFGLSPHGLLLNHIFEHITSLQ